MLFDYKLQNADGVDVFAANNAESEKHNPFLLFEEYSSDRVGWHIYRNDDVILGYYENGTTTRLGSLQRAKTWMRGKIKSKNGEMHFCGFTFFSPVIMLFLTAVPVVSWLLIPFHLGKIIECAAVTLLSLVFLFFMNKDKIKACDELDRELKQLITDM